MIAKSIDQIIVTDLQALIDNAVLENKTIEYKQLLPNSSDSDKKEFLADVSSFANASGGDLIFGIIQNRDTGIPEKLEGLDIENIDQEILRLDNLIRDGIAPRIPSVISKPIKLLNSKTALIIRVSKSWISPHRVTFKGYDRFYSRGANGKYPLDVTELRIAFTLSETLVERVKRFRESRISQVYAGETPVPLSQGAKVVLHLVPLISFSPAQRYDIDPIASKPEKMAPMNHYMSDQRYNLDGFLTYSVTQTEESYSYVQLFRNGIIEAVDALTLSDENGAMLIPGTSLEEEIIRSFPNYLSVLKSLEVELPIFAFLTLVGVKGYSMGIARVMLLRRVPHKIEKDILLLPEVVIEDYAVDVGDILRPCFDSIWNACGLPKSVNYDDAGKWKRRS